MADHGHGDDPTTAPAGGESLEMHGPKPPNRVSGRTRRRLMTGLLVLLALGGAAAGVGVLTGFLPNPVVAGDPNASGHGEGTGTGTLTVKVIRPKREPNFRITTRQFAVVEPYYSAGLRARVTGVVRAVPRNIGESVRAGDLLVEIDAPELKQAVEQKDAFVAQREKELAVSASEVAVARSAVQAADIAVAARELDVGRVTDVLKSRRSDLESALVLFKDVPEVRLKVEAVRFEYQAAETAVAVAKSEVEKAKVERAGKAASLEKALADVELKRAQVEVARRDRDAAATQFGFCRLYAPYDGVVVARNVDPGRFVSAGTGGSTEPLVTVARTDLVTVVAKIPDNAAPFVSLYTEAVIEFAQLPGVTVRGPITRYSQAIDPADQTMRVEIDVYNGSRRAYRAMLERAAAPIAVGPLVPFDRLAGLVALRVSAERVGADGKAWYDGGARIPDWGTADRYRQIVPGMTAHVRLDLERFDDAYLLPSTAIYARAGQSYILVVENGVTRGVPVTVQMNDGTLAKVAVVVPGPGGRQVTRELTGTEVIVATRQLEVGEGRQVSPAFDP